MHVYILGICGTFMGGVALLAKQLGHQVSGSDRHVYPPMSTQLEEQGIALKNGYDPSNLEPRPDLVVIGNALSRGNPEIEAILNRRLPYISGPRWLSEHLLKDRWVLAVAGTHGKTTASSMTAWILEEAGLEPGFLIGGIPMNFGLSARLGKAPYFVVEADEYDTAFFDKRSKFVHYQPRTLVLNNLEFDHADIFPDLAAIQRQFHHLVRITPGNGLIIAPQADDNLAEVLAMGCWTSVVHTGIAPEQTDCEWLARLDSADGSRFDVLYQGRKQGTVLWPLTGQHNVSNALSALAAAHHAGIAAETGIDALSCFKSVKRRMEIYATVNGITLYDDSAHHPTAIASTLEGLRNRVGRERIIAIFEPRSNTMRLGVHADTLAHSLQAADAAIVYQADALDWDTNRLAEQAANVRIEHSLEAILTWLTAHAGEGDHLVLMSNGSFGGLHRRLEQALRDR